MVQGPQSLPWEDTAYATLAEYSQECVNLLAFTHGWAWMLICHGPRLELLCGGSNSQCDSYLAIQTADRHLAPNTRFETRTAIALFGVLGLCLW